MLGSREGDAVLNAQRLAWPGGSRLRSPWQQGRFVVFDTETTGLDPKADRPVSLGAVSVVGGRIVVGYTFERVIAAEADLSRRSIVVHGLTPDRVARGSDPGQAVGEFLLWAGDAVLVAHHAAFDLAMLNSVQVAARGWPIQNLVLDTAHLAKRVAPAEESARSYSLDRLLDRYEIPQSGARHTALGDALLTARLLQKLLKRLHARGLTRLLDLAMLGPEEPRSSH